MIKDMQTGGDEERKNRFMGNKNQQVKPKRKRES